MRLAESHGVSRGDFLKNYIGSQLDPRWLNRVSKRSARGWKNLVARDKDCIKDLRTSWRVRPVTQTRVVGRAPIDDRPVARAYANHVRKTPA